MTGEIELHWIWLWNPCRTIPFQYLAHCRAHLIDLCTCHRCVCKFCSFNWTISDIEWIELTEYITFCCFKIKWYIIGWICITGIDDRVIRDSNSTTREIDLRWIICRNPIWTIPLQYLTCTCIHLRDFVSRHRTIRKFNRGNYSIFDIQRVKLTKYFTICSDATSCYKFICIKNCSIDNCIIWYRNALSREIELHWIWLWNPCRTIPLEYLACSRIHLTELICSNCAISDIEWVELSEYITFCCFKIKWYIISRICVTGIDDGVIWDCNTLTCFINNCYIVWSNPCGTIPFHHLTNIRIHAIEFICSDGCIG